MDSLRTSSLFHYPQKLDTLKKILAQGFKPNYCKETYSIADYPDLIVGIPMVSFCDIPLTRIRIFKNRYKEYALGLSKEWGLKNGINPVLYATTNSFVLNSLRELDEIRIQKDELLKKRMVDIGKPLIIHGQNYLTLPLRCNDPDYLHLLYSFDDNRRLFLLRSTLFGLTKAYSERRGGKLQINYEENEWRFVKKENKLTKIDWLWGGDAYLNWRNNGNKHKPESQFESLKFNVNDINFIILQSDNQIPKMIKYIEGLNEFGGNVIKDKTQESILKSILISKIISMNRISKDF